MIKSPLVIMSVENAPKQVCFTCGQWVAADDYHSCLHSTLYTLHVWDEKIEKFTTPDVLWTPDWWSCPIWEKREATG